MLSKQRAADRSSRYLFETTETDLEALSAKLTKLAPAAPAEREKQQPERTPLPASLPRRNVHHEPDSTTCSCGRQLRRIDENVPEKLDYQPGVFTVERYVHGKWVCGQREAPVPAHITGKGIPTAGLLAQVLGAK